MLNNGRPEVGEELKPMILNILNSFDYPLTIKKIQNAMQLTYQRKISHTTIRKYILTMVRTEMVEKIPMKEAKNQKIFAVYKAKTI